MRPPVRHRRTVLAARPGSVAPGPGALGVIGAGLIAAGWFQAAGTVEFGDQVRAGVLSTAGLAAISVAVVSCTLTGRRVVEHRMAELLRAAAAIPPLPGPANAGGSAPVIVATASMGWYHRPSCPLARGKPVAPASRSAHEAAGRWPCGICRP